MQHFLDFLGSSRYVIVFMLSIVEGPVVMISSGFLYRLGQFDLLPLYIALVAGDFVADIGWYAVGRFGGGPLVRRYGKFLKLTPDVVNKIEERFKHHQNKILFISKITMGFGFALATLIVAGMLRVDFKKYVSLNFLGGFIWAGFLLVIGYYFGNIYASLEGPLKALYVPILLIGIVLGLWLINRYFIKHEI